MNPIEKNRDLTNAADAIKAKAAADLAEVTAEMHRLDAITRPLGVKIELAQAALAKRPFLAEMLRRHQLWETEMQSHFDNWLLRSGEDVNVNFTAGHKFPETFSAPWVAERLVVEIKKRIAVNEANIAAAVLDAQTYAAENDLVSALPADLQ